MDAITIKEGIEIGTTLWYGIGALVLLAMSAMASGSEVAFFSLTRSDIQDLESKEDGPSRRVMELLENRDRLLATILVVNNMVNICLVIVTTQLIESIFSFTGVWEFIFNTIVITFLLLLFGEIMPKVFSQTNPVRMTRQRAAAGR